MSTIKVSLPELLSAFVDSQVTNGGYGSSSEYMTALLSKEQGRVLFRRLILDGAESELMDEPADSRYFDKLRKRIAAK